MLHGWESGLDASPLYDAAYGLQHPGPVTESLYLKLYPKFDELEPVLLPPASTKVVLG